MTLLRSSHFVKINHKTSSGHASSHHNLGSHPATAPNSIKWEETLQSGVQLSSSKGDGGGLGSTYAIMTGEAGGTLPCGSEQPLESLTSTELSGSSWEVSKL